MEATISTTSTKPRHISPIDAIWAIIQNQSASVKQALYIKIEEERKKEESRNENILRQIEELEEGPDGFLKLCTILPPSKLSPNELREDAYIEKYGI